VLKWKIQNDLKLVFAIIYKEILQLAFIDELLEMLRYEFVSKIYPTLAIKGDIFITLPGSFDSNFQTVWKKWEIKSKELQGPKQMKTFSETNKGKKIASK
jgi:hypothetical protein